MSDDPLERTLPHPLLGRQARVIIARKGIERKDGVNVFEETGPHEILDHDVVVEGVLMRLNAGGDVAVLQDDGVTMYAWPALDIEPRWHREESFRGWPLDDLIAEGRREVTRLSQTVEGYRQASQTGWPRHSPPTRQSWTG
jgi:hypothetical protein